MKLRSIDPPRAFVVSDPQVEVTHCADVSLEPDEQVTFVTASGTEFDVVRKVWGYYGTPSLNRRLPAHGLRPVLALSNGSIYLLLVEAGKEEELSAYIQAQGMNLLLWLDTDDALSRICSASCDGDRRQLD